MCAADHSGWRQTYDAVRSDSLQLTGPRSDEDCGAQSIARARYRNLFPFGARWQFSGIRLAR